MKYILLITIIITFAFRNVYANDSFSYFTQNDPKSNSTIDYSHDKSSTDYNTCDTILGISYISGMVGSATGIIGGLCWAFYPKTKIASMATCLTGCGLFVFGLTAGLITSNIYCKPSKNLKSNNFHDKYDLVLNIDIINKNYIVGFSLKY